MRSVTVVYHSEDGNWWADSPTPGLETFVAGGGALDETRRLAREGLEFYLGDEPLLTELYEGFPVLTYLETHSDLPIVVSGGMPGPSRRQKITVVPAQPCVTAG